MECRKYKNPYDTCISDIMLWRLGPNEWLQKLHGYTNQIATSIFQTGFFIFFISLGTCPRLCSSARNVDCAASFPLLCRLNRHACVCHFFWADFKLRFKILTPTKTTRKAATNRFVVSPLVLDCIKGSYMGVFRGFNLNHVILSLKSKLHLSFTNVPHAVH
mgnify:CR=1 FL=1